MTARHQVRIGNRRLGRDRTAIDATPAPRLGEVLQLARENKGVDLYRAERDTKIRLRYLAALEDSDFDELPAAVYTKGFLRNYAIYLGLDPEEVLIRWREEMDAARSSERVAVAPPPRPITVPRRGFTLSPGIFMAALLSAVVIGFIAYIGMQLLRFADAPLVELDSPPSLVSTVNSENVLLRGTAAAGALIQITGPGDQPFQAYADEAGAWSREVPLALGRNDFRIVAIDPVTTRESDPINVIVTVPLPSSSPDASPTAAPPAAISLTLRGPLDGSTVTSGPVTVSGSTNATRVTIVPTYLGEPGAAPQPSPDEAQTPEPGPSGSPGVSGPSAPTVDLTVPPGGTFSEDLNLLPGEWSVTVTASSAGLAPKTETRTVTVAQPQGLQLEIEVLRRESWLRVMADGEVVSGYGGRTVEAGETHTFTATDEIWLRAGNAGVLRITLNGQDLGLLGKGGEVGNWYFRPGQPPERTSERP